MGYTSRRLFALAVLLCVLCAAFIYAMSAEPVDVSRAHSSEITGQIVSAFLPDTDADPIERDNTIASADHVFRKAAHFCVNAVFGGLLCFASLGYAATWYVHGGRSLLIGAIYAVSDEIHQAFVPGRGPAVTDVLLDSAGVLCGIAVMLLIARHIWWKKKVSV